MTTTAETREREGSRGSVGSIEGIITREREGSRGRLSQPQISPGTARRLLRTKGTPPPPLNRSNSNDEELSMPSVEHKYQTIQSVRPEEVKEFFSQHFLEADGTPKTSLPEDGVRRFSLVQRTFKTRKYLRNSKDAAMFKEEMQSAEGKKIMDEIRASETASTDGSSSASITSSASRDAIELITLREEVAKLNNQLKQEREAHSKELARLRAQSRAFQLKLNDTHKRMETLIITMDAREKAVQELLAKTRVVDENMQEAAEGLEEKASTSSSPAASPSSSSSISSSSVDAPLSPPISLPALPPQANVVIATLTPRQIAAQS